MGLWSATLRACSVLGVALALGSACVDELPPPEPSAAAGASAGTGGSDAAAGGSGGAAGAASCPTGFGNCDGLAANGCEQSLDIEGHCGACQRSCLGAACTQARCEAITLVSGLTRPWGVLVDATSIYFSDYMDGTIEKANKLDGSSRVQLAAGYASTWFMQLDGDHVYFTTRMGDSIERVLSAGGTPAETFLSPGVKTSGLAIDDSHVFFTESEAPGAVWRANKNPGAISQVLVAAQAQPFGIAVGSGYVYWGSADGGDGSVNRANKNKLAGTAEPIASGQTAVRNVIFDQDMMVYWTSSTSTVGRVVRYDVSQAQLPQTLATTGPAEHSAIDETHIYWAASEGTLGQLYRLPKNHDPTEQPAPVEKLFEEDGTELITVAVDATAAYFTDAGKGRILKVAK